MIRIPDRATTVAAFRPWRGSWLITIRDLTITVHSSKSTGHYIYENTRKGNPDLKIEPALPGTVLTNQANIPESVLFAFSQMLLK